MKKMTAMFTLGLLASTMLLGCGQTPASPTTPKRNQMPVQRLQPAAGWNGQPGAAGAADAQTQALLSAVRQAQTTNQGFTATVDTWEKGQGKTEAGTLKIAFKKPSTLRLTIAKSTNTQATGVKLRWDGGSEFRIKPTWMPFAVGVGITDKRVVSLNNWTIKDTDVTCILNVLLDPAAQVKVLGDQPFDGMTLTAVEVRSPKSPKGTSHEIIGVDRATGLPKARLIFKGQELTYKLMVKQMSMKVPSETDLSM